jgi:hypothetical protein
MRIHARGFLLSSIALALASIAHVSVASPLAIGPVERFDSKTASVVILGQSYSIASAKLIAGSKSMPATQGLKSLAAGALVRVDGALGLDGTAKVGSFTVLPETNVQGATQLFVAGVVKTLDATGKLTIGDLRIDINSALSSRTTEVRVGDAIEVVGFQPVSSGIFIATATGPLRAQATAGASVSGIGRTGVSGIGGTGAS